MRLLSMILILLLTPSILAGCTTSPGQNKGGYLNKTQVLKLSPDADIFELDGKVYKTDIDWIEKEELTKEEQVGEITEDMANKLPVGAKIFAPKERKDILIVEYDGKGKRYLLQVGE
ncbi:hypothetical protein F7731_09645 [Cytobacillus depressus]|uniref:DUF3221 domain-containing protein n=1 Tax=Cytobacillus depressus TaxID=1602942 RepID=A0A6L3V624_9BACI|nr:hypothetical protein [Cytobacillus depressus]KAB2336618.1 hypothetical protein F7731_09645 [Cytobacillus depressus]